MRLFSLLGVALAFCFSFSVQAAAKRPNVVVILTDDQGWGDLSVHGNVNLATPNIDSLAKTGALFERFFVCPVCSPTRAEFLTGRYHLRGGVHDVSTGGERLNLDEKTIGNTFKAAGYATGMFGKWHNGSQWPYHPNARGFDEYYGFTSGHWGDYFDALLLDHNGKLETGKGYLIDDLASHAMQFIEQNKDKSFFCYVPFNSPHSPEQVPREYMKKYEGKDLKLRSREPADEDPAVTKSVLAMCENLDWNVGRILKRLDDLKLADNTIVIYFCDNGPNTWRWNGEMKGRKGSVDEGGVRSPFLIRWPGQIKGGTRVTQIAGAIDLLPTLADCAGIPLASNKPLDGLSLKPLLLGTAKDWPDRTIFTHWGGKLSARTQQYRYTEPGQLFDLQADPKQDRNLAAEKPEVAERMAGAVKQWHQEVSTGLKVAVKPAGNAAGKNAKGKARGGLKKNDDRPFTVGYSEFPMTQLPARDGVAHGGVQRSAGAPNCSYFTKWSSVDDRITWDVEVNTAGKYEAVVYYTCPKADIGSTFEVSFNGNRIEGTVSEANDPPLIGADHDIVPRKGESYVKDFKPLKLGQVDLKAGRGELALKALKVPGKQVMEVRLVTLTLVK
jgi:arylsulfatase A-like enzyme